MAGYEMQKEQILARLARIAGQVRGISRMVADDRYCVDVLDQVTAVKRALEQVAVGLVHEHLHHCVLDAAGNDASGATSKINEASAAVERLLRS